jgi:hypothetical protein
MLLKSRKIKGWPHDHRGDEIPAFSKKMIEEFAEGMHEGQKEAARAGRPEARA